MWNIYDTPLMKIFLYWFSNTNGPKHKSSNKILRRNGWCNYLKYNEKSILFNNSSEGEIHSIDVPVNYHVISWSNCLIKKNKRRVEFCWWKTSLISTWKSLFFCSIIPSKEIRLPIWICFSNHRGNLKHFSEVFLAPFFRISIVLVVLCYGI